MAFTITSGCIGCTACVRACPVGAIVGEKKAQHFIEKELCIECGACGRVCPKGAIRDSDGMLLERLQKKLWAKPVIDEDKCYACENCVEACPAGALAMKSEDLPLLENQPVLLYPEKCVSCGWCVDNCQFGAIRLEVIDENN